MSATRGYEANHKKPRAIEPATIRTFIPGVAGKDYE